MAKRKKQDRMEPWITSMVFGPLKDKYGALQELRLEHVGPGGDLVGTIEAFPVSAEPDGSYVQSLYESVLQSAESDATALGHYQKYALMAYFMVDGEMQSMARFTFAQSAGEGDEQQDGIVATEPATTIGFLAQNQRHLEATMRMGIQSGAQAQQSLIMQNQRLSDQIDKLLEERIKTMELVTDLLDKKSERETRAKDAEATTKIRERAAGTFLPLLPIVLNKLTGGKLLPEGKGKSALASFSKTLTPDQVNAMMAPLDDSQKMVLLEALQEVMASGDVENAAPNGEAEPEPKVN